MSITLEVRGQTNSTWALSTTCLEQIDRLRKTDARRSVDTFFGSEDVQAGTARAAGRRVLLQAISDLLPVAKRMPGGFEVHVPPLFEGAGAITARGAGGVLIGGRHHYINCWDDYWTIQPTEEMRDGKEPVRHYEPAEIQSQNMGIIKVQAKKSGQSDLAKLLREVRKFLESDSGSDVIVTWG